MSFGPVPWRSQPSLPSCGCWFIQPGIPLVKQYFPRVDLTSHTTILSSTSRTKLTQKFVNPYDDAIPEAQYTFPLYDGVSVVAFNCSIGERVITGIVKEKYQARFDYDEAVRHGETAGLLEQMPEAGDVFSTKLGNIPKGETIVVDIEYLGELKHDAEKDGVRFTIPTAIAPRYGNLSYPTSQTFSRNNTFNQYGIKIIVEVAVESGVAIRGLSSPSHPIAVTMGRNSHQDESVFQNNLASATLALAGTTDLDQDFVIVVNVQGQDAPRALLETHPKHGRAIMTTLVPKFNLPNIYPEIVFVVDRSGSMKGKIAMVVQALNIFLRSLPTSAKFNICSFGSRYSFLFDKSRQYDEASLNEALFHLERFEADYGGTELQLPVEKTVEQRYKGVPLEIMILTDGQIWQQQALFTFLQSASKDQVRVFSLGIGSQASTSLVEGMARAGSGFAQFVQDGEQIDKRVVRMLKAALTPHVTDYTLEIKYETDQTSMEDDFEIIESFTESMKTVVSSISKPTAKPVSLFDTDFKEQPPNPLAGRYDHLPSIAVPKILQAPHRIPALYAFNRTTIYLLFGPDSSERPIKSVVLRGSCDQGPLELEIPVQNVGDGKTIHQLAAKRAVQELEEGQGWIVEARSTNGEFLKTQNEADWERIVEREAVRLGTQFQIAGKHCSFVAFEANNEDDEGSEKQVFANLAISTYSNPSANDEKFKRAPRRRNRMAAAPPPPAASAAISPPAASGQTYARTFCISPKKAKRAAFGSPASNIPGSANISSGLFGFSNQPAMMNVGTFGSATQSFGNAFGTSNAPASPTGTSSPDAVNEVRSLWDRDRSDDLAQSLRRNQLRDLSDDTRKSQAPTVQTSSKRTRGEIREEKKESVLSSLGQDKTTSNLTPEETMHRIISLQRFAGFWERSALLLQYLGITENAFNTSSLGTHDDDTVKATASVLAWLEVKLAAEKEVWEMVADKARAWLVSQDGVDDAETLVGSTKDLIT